MTSGCIIAHISTNLHKFLMGSVLVITRTNKHIYSRMPPETITHFVASLACKVIKLQHCMPCMHACYTLWPFC